MRVKRGLVKKRKHNKILQLAKGYRMSYSKLYRRAKEAVLHAGQYSYEDRKHRQAQYRKIWIRKIAAVCKQNSINYSQFINSLKKANVVIDRKILAYLITNHEFAMTKLLKDVT